MTLAGFSNVSIDTNARTAPASEYTFAGNLGYYLAKTLNVLTLGYLNIVPGVLVIAQK